MKNKNIFSKTVSSVLAITVLFGALIVNENNTIIANAENAPVIQTLEMNKNATIYTIDDTTKGILSSVALDWAEISEPNKRLEIGKIDRILNAYDNKEEYYVSYNYGTIPYGYAVICWSDDSFVVKEATMSMGVKDLYTETYNQIIASIPQDISSIDTTNEVVEISPLEYGLVYSDNGKEYIINETGNTQENTDVAELRGASTSYSSVVGLFIKNGSFSASKYKVEQSSMMTLNQYRYRNYLPSETEIEKLTKKYACGVQAMLQIAYMSGYCSKSTDDIIDAYIYMWIYGNVSVYKTNNGISYGENSMSDMVKGYKEYVKHRGYSLTTHSIKINPSVNWIKTRLSYDQPMLMSFGVNVNGSRAGHFISILGYRRATKVSSGNTYNYLMVYDGWNSKASYLNYTAVDLTDCCVAYFN